MVLEDLKVFRKLKIFVKELKGFGKVPRELKGFEKVLRELKVLLVDGVFSLSSLSVFSLNAVSFDVSSFSVDVSDFPSRVDFSFSVDVSVSSFKVDFSHVFIFSFNVGFSFSVDVSIFLFGVFRFIGATLLHFFLIHFPIFLY